MTGIIVVQSRFVCIYSRTAIKSRFSDNFLVALRHATVVKCLPTTHLDIIMKIVKETGINEASFVRNYQNGNAEKVLTEDLAFARRLGICSLSTYLIQYQDKALVMQIFEYADFAEAIEGIISH